MDTKSYRDIKSIHYIDIDSGEEVVLDLVYSGVLERIMTSSTSGLLRNGTRVFGRICRPVVGKRLVLVGEPVSRLTANSNGIHHRRILTSLIVKFWKTESGFHIETESGSSYLIHTDGALDKKSAV